MAIALVQSAVGTNAAPTLPSAVGSNGLVIIGVNAINNGVTATGFTNVGGFQRIQASDVGVMYFRKAEASGSSGVYALNGSNPWCIAEFSGVDLTALETATNTQQDGSFPAGAAHWTQSLTTPGSGEVLVVSCFCWNNQNTNASPFDSPFTSIGRSDYVGNTKAMALGYHIDGTDNGSYTSGMTNTTPSISYWGHVIASYAAGAGGATSGSQAVIIA